MKALEVLRIRDRTVKDEERLVLLAKVDIDNIHDYAVIDATFDHRTGRSNRHRHFYRFPVKGKGKEPVKKGDKVIVYTKEGDDDTQENKSSGNTSHFYYMNLNTPIWNQSGDTATVLYCEEVDSKTV